MKHNLVLLILVVLTISTGSTVLECGQLGQCLDATVIGVTYPDSAISCLQDCKGQENCLFYTFQPEINNLCELLSSCETFDTEGCSSCTSGSVSCPADVICSVQGLCQEGISIDAIEAQSEVDCWSKCKDTDGCAWYSFFTTKGYCYLLQNCPIINEEFVDFTSGEVTCQFGTTTSMPTISTTLSPDKGYTKLLVTAGFNYNTGDYIRSSEVIDLSNPNVNCQQWPDYPINVNYGVGGYINESVITCGGYSNGYATDRCFKMEPSKTTEIPGLKIGSYDSGGGIIQDSLVVSGGYDRSFNRLKRIEILNEQGSTNGPDMPMALWGHCNIIIDSNTYLTTGGFSNDGYYSRKTWYFNFSTEEWTSGPDLIDDRSYHACGKFKIGDQIVLILAGSGTSVKFLPLNETNWITGPSLPFNPWYESHFIVSNTDKTFFVDTFNNRFLVLDCTNLDLASCSWKEMEQKLKSPRDWRPFVTLIPDRLTNCT